MLCGNRRGIYFRNVEAAGDRTEVTFASDITVVLVFIIRFGMLFRRNGEDVVIDFNVDLVSGVSGKFCVYNVTVTGIADIRFKSRLSFVTEEGFLPCSEFLERIIAVFLI